MKKIVFAVATGILTLGLLAQAPANPAQTQKSSPKLAGQTQTQTQTQTQPSKGEEKPAAHKKHHKGTKPAEKPAATTAPTK